MKLNTNPLNLMLKINVNSSIKLLAFKGTALFFHIYKSGELKYSNQMRHTLNI